MVITNSAYFFLAGAAFRSQLFGHVVEQLVDDRHCAFQFGLGHLGRLLVSCGIFSRTFLPSGDW
jgi:hypothetical protein